MLGGDGPLGLDPGRHRHRVQSPRGLRHPAAAYARPDRRWVSEREVGGQHEDDPDRDTGGCLRPRPLTNIAFNCQQLLMCDLK